MDLSGKYAVRFVDDDALPPEQEWAFFVCDDTGTICLAMKRGHVTEAALEDAWAAFRQRVRIPRQRPVEAVAS